MTAFVPPRVVGRRPDDRLVVPIRGGAADLRPLRSGETDAVRAVFEGMSASARVDRYFVPVTRLSGTLLTALADVDGHDRVAWLAAVDEQPAGIARYHRVDPVTAEVAFEVVDRHHGRGLGTALLDAVLTVAAVSGVTRLRASVLPHNTASRRLLGRLGIPMVVRDGILEGEGPLRLLDPAVVDRGAVVALAASVTYGPWTTRLDSAH